MTRISVSRRKLLQAGACALAGAAGLSSTASGFAGTAASKTNEELIRRWYKLWEERSDWGRVGAMLADNFTFTSAAGDDHISKSAFKRQCFDTQIGFVERVDIERLIGSGDWAFVKYLGHTRNGKSFRNVEYFLITDGKVQAIECYFGGKDTFPSAVSSGT